MIWTQAQIRDLAAHAGSGGDPDTAAAVAMAESAGDDGAVGDQGTSFGLWQIHLPAHPDVTRDCALAPQCAAQAAYQISNGWTNFHPWSTFNDGSYRKFLDGGRDTDAPAAPSLVGQAVVGQQVSAPWFDGAWEITQGYGQTDYEGEPEGHGYLHWHAGVDVGLDCGTEIRLPTAVGATARPFDNPNGYGTALKLELDTGEDVILGHLQGRLVGDGEEVRPGSTVAISNNTGNSSGCHLHFEVRPRGGKYGTDSDPSALLLTGEGAAFEGLVQPAGPDLGAMTASAVSKLIQAGQIALGGALALGGLLLAAYALRGRSAGTLRRDATRLVTGVQRRRRAGQRIRAREAAGQARAEQARNREIYRAQQRRRPVVLGATTPAEIAADRAAQVRRTRLRQNLQQSA